MTSKLVIAAAERNKGPILDVLQRVLVEKFGNADINTLEIGSGTGQHAVHFSSALKNVVWQPSDIDFKYLNSINEYISESKLANIKSPIKLDISADKSEWEKLVNESYKMIISINLVHISPWKCTEGLFKVAGQLLETKGILVTYGPYAINGKITPESNVRFDNGLKNENSEWGLRDIKDLEVEAKKNGLCFDAMVDMPSNNKTLIWQKN